MMSTKLIISAEALSNNASLLQKNVGSFYAVLKCDAYGHGALLCAKTLYGCGVRHFATYSVEEAIEIKPFIGKSEVLILGRTPASLASSVIENGFLQTVVSGEHAEELSPVSKGMRVHIKLDTGMNRCGFKEDSEYVKKSFSRFAGEIEGVYTHFPFADGVDLSPTKKALDDFLNRSCELEGLLGKKLKKHAAASAAAMRLPRSRLDISRIGLALYGCLPSKSVLAGLLPVMSLYGRVILVKTVKKGENIGYGCDQTVKKDSVIATVSAGYANGLHRNPEMNCRPLLCGRRVPFAGRVCMDRCMLDVTDIYENGDRVGIYDEVCFLGENPSVTELAKTGQTIPYEVLTRIGKMNGKTVIYK